ncbi:hypothetical protein HRI_002145200 [Hibiscus trionum]|uniref:Reverse transcriptase domain-containing protein n=1 Tax=Hibiscus trionum TaxID=183268 RepID=A0A9W7HW70_HIBTR|nr:hypothetical protein HRI_002145200 [Hibiscus trionum]
MKILSWNVRGLGQSRTVGRLRNFLRDVNPAVIFLIETKLQSAQMEKVRKSFGYQFGIDISSRGRSGGLSLAWKSSCKVTLRSFSVRHIDVILEEDSDGCSWRFTGFYGAPEVENRAASWNLLRQLNDLPDFPWMVMGDFNELLFASEKSGGRLRNSSQMDNFRNALEDCSLKDVGFRGPWYTWEWGRLTSNNIRERLDRGVANDPWWSLFSHFDLEHLPHTISDHCPLLLNTHAAISTRQQFEHFRFEAAWLVEESCEQEVSRLWNASAGSIPTRLRQVGEGLNSWFRTLRKEKRITVTDLKTRLKELSELHPSDEVLGEILDTKIALNLEADREELYWEQRARANWLNNGDRNTSFFHSFASQRRNRNRIRKLRGANDEIIDSDEGIFAAVVEYFKSLYMTKGVDDPSTILDEIDACVSSEMNRSLLRTFSRDEVLVAVRSMGPLKASGKDGIGAVFYQRFWHIVGKEVADYCIDVINGLQDISEINSTHIVLVPKVDDPINMSQFRPISLCNVLYKIIAKVLANRFQHALPKCIDEAQCAFLLGRLISDNIIAGYEVLHCFKNRRMERRGSFALKLDMSKTYDMVEWPFIEAIMRKLGFADQWISLISKCICMVNYAVVINGGISEYFVPTRGLRQGDPLSPYLFLICSEGLSALLRGAISNGSLRGARIARGALLISHLLFANDSIIFREATAEGAAQLKDLLDMYSRCSGHCIKFSKSSVYFSSNVIDANENDVCRVLAVQMQTCLDKYLGLPSMVGRNKKRSLTFMAEKCSKSLSTWSPRLLSMGGKEVYIKAVLQALPLYAMSVFLLPKSPCQDLQAKFVKYWWQKKTDKKGIHWCSWSELCVLKEDDGMSFRDMGKFNIALLAKQGWRIIINPTSLVARILKAKYFPTVNFMHSRVGSNPSYILRSIWASKRTLELGLFWRVDAGRSVSIWNDYWLPDFPLRLVSSPAVPEL